LKIWAEENMPLFNCFEDEGIVRKRAFASYKNLPYFQQRFQTKYIS